MRSNALKDNDGIGLMKLDKFFISFDLSWGHPKIMFGCHFCGKRDLKERAPNDHSIKHDGGEKTDTNAKTHVGFICTQLLNELG